MVRIAYFQALWPGRNNILGWILVLILFSALLGACRPANPNRSGLAMIPNQGQQDARVRYHALAEGANLFFLDSGLFLALWPQHALAGSGLAGGIPLEIRFEGAATGTFPVGRNPLQQQINLILGENPALWQSGIRPYEDVVYPGLYPGVDLVFNGQGAVARGGFSLKGTYYLAPGADPEQIRWRYEGPYAQEITPDGSLQLSFGKGDSRLMVTENAPLAWQRVGGGRVNVPVAYELFEDGTVGFRLGEFDPGLRLVIDPTLEYSSYLGGVTSDEAVDVTVDGARNAILVGSTLSVDFPSDFPIQETLVGSRNIFVTKLARNGSEVEFSTILGGSGDDFGRAITTDNTGDIYLTGQTFSQDFPTSLPPIAPEDGGADIFIIKLSLTGGTIRYSVKVGGANFDDALDISVDPSGRAVAVGMTASQDFPTARPMQPRPGGGESDGFMVKLNAVGNELLYSTYLGGSAAEAALGVATDRKGFSFVTGWTDSIDFPTVEPLQEDLLGREDAFLVKVEPEGAGFPFSTYLGVGESTTGLSIIVDREGAAYIAGGVEAGEAGTEGFVAKINADGNEKIFTTVFGGSGDEEGLALGIDRERNIYVTGSTDSEDLGSASSIQPAYGGNGDAFITQLDPAGQVVTHNYIGGSDYDIGSGITVFGSGEAVLVGTTYSADFPLLNPIQGEYKGEGDAFVLKIGDIKFIPTPVPTNTPEPTPLPPTPTPLPTGLNAIVQSNYFLYFIFGMIGLVILLMVVEIIRGLFRRRKS